MSDIEKNLQSIETVSTTEKIYYTSDGWLCNRYPTDFPIEDESLYVEVSAEEAKKTYSSPLDKYWRVVDGELVLSEYDPDVTAKVSLEAELMELTKWFTQYDNQVQQYLRASRLGEEFDKDIDELDAQAKTNAARINEIRQQLASYDTVEVEELDD